MADQVGSNFLLYPEAENGDLLVAASTHEFGAGGNDGWLIRLDSDGAILWQKSYGGTGEDWFRRILPAGDGTFTVQGITDSFGAGQTDIWLLKLNGDGGIAWQKTYGGASAEIGKAWLTGDGGYAVVGGTDSFGQGQAVLKMWFLRRRKKLSTRVSFWLG